MSWRDLLRTFASGWTILIRLLVGLVVFFPEGIQKLAFPEILGADRFANIGIPYPELMGPFVGVVETVCGALIIIGFLTRLAAIPLLIIIILVIARSDAAQFRPVAEGSSAALQVRLPTARGRL